MYTHTHQLFGSLVLSCLLSPPPPDDEGALSVSLLEYHLRIKESQCQRSRYISQCQEQVSQYFLQKKGRRKYFRWQWYGACIIFQFCLSFQLYGTCTHTCACNLSLHTHSVTDTPDKETAPPTAAPGTIGRVRRAVYFLAYLVNTTFKT